MVTAVDAATAVVVTVNVAVVLPASTVTLVGTVPAALFLDKATEMPPFGAALVKVTVPVEEVPPVTLVGLTETDEIGRAAGRERTEVSVVAVSLKEMVTAVDEATAVVVTVNVAVVLPASTAKLAGTVAAALF